MTKNGFLGAFGDQGDGTYLNPILEADYSDPDVVRYGGKYYMIASTFQFSPGMTILESTDLVNWKMIGSIIYNLAELNPKLNWDKMEGYGHGVYAGSLRYLEWKEKDEKGGLVQKSRWFMHTTIYLAGIVVATAEQVTGPWHCQFMRDCNGEELRAQKWDDNCPYWEFNEDGTLKAAYMIASKPNKAWYMHIFQMSLDGTQLLDGDVRFMSLAGDTTRKRTGEPPASEIFIGTDSGDPLGEIIDKYANKVIPTSNEIDDAHCAQMNELGDIASVLNATHYPNREGTVIRDIVTAEASKIIGFGNYTIIGKTTFTGRHGKEQKVSDYVYIFNSEVWDNNSRFPILHRAKSIYGDRFSDKGEYIGAGTPSNPGTYESQRLIVNTTEPFDARQPNQGGYVDIPPDMSTDGKEHWYFLTHHGNERVGPQCRPTSLLPVTWIDGWPIIGMVDCNGCFESIGKADVAATIYDGTGINGNTNNQIHHPNAKYKPGTMMWSLPKPPVKNNGEILNFQDSDNFGDGENGGQQNSYSGKLSPNWYWNHVPREHFWSLTNKTGKLRLYAFHTVDHTWNFFKIGNVISQRYINADEVSIEIKMDISKMQNGQEAGIAHFNGGKSFSSIGVMQDNKGIRSLSNDLLMSEVVISSNVINIIFRSRVNIDRINTFEYSTDEGSNFIKFGSSYKLIPAGYRGDCIGLYTFNNNDSGSLPKGYKPGDDHEFGCVDFDYFKYEYLSK